MRSTRAVQRPGTVAGGDGSESPTYSRHHVVPFGHHVGALRKGVGRPTGIDPLRMEPPRIKCVANDDRIRKCCLLGDSAIRFAQQSRVGRIRDLSDKPGCALPLPVPGRYDFARRLTLRRATTSPLRRSTNVTRPRGLTPNRPRQGQRVIPGLAVGQLHRRDVRNVSGPRGDDRGFPCFGGDHGGVSLQGLNPCRVPDWAVQRANVAALARCGNVFNAAPYCAKRGSR